MNKSAQSTDPQDAIVALFQYSPPAIAELSRTPLLAVYGDGRIIVRRTQDGNGRATAPSYWTGWLTLEQQIELNARQVAVLRDPELKEQYDVSERRDGWTTTTFVFTDKNKVLHVTADGLFAGEFDLGREKHARERLPASLAAYHQFLVMLLFDTEKLSPWKPEAYVARLYAVRPQARIVKWPSQWPTPASTRLRLNEGNVEIVVPVSSGEFFWAAIPGGRSGSVIAAGGKFWEVECFPCFPGHEKWFAELAGTEEWLGDPHSLCMCLPVWQISGFHRMAAAVWERPVWSMVAPNPKLFKVPFPVGAFPEILLPGHSLR